MASHKEKLFFDKPPSVLMLAYQEATRAMGLKIVSQERFKLVARETPLQNEKMALPMTVEVKIAPLSEGTGVELSASNLGIGASQNERVEEFVNDLKNFFDKEMEKPNLEQERLAKIRAREEREAEERAKEMEEENRLETIYQQKLAQLKAEEEAALLRRLPAGRSDGDDESPAPRITSGSSNSNARSSGSSNSNVGTPSLAEELQRLADLHQSGILDDEEFKAAKRALLSR